MSAPKTESTKKKTALFSTNTTDAEFLALVEREESAIYQFTSEELVDWQNARRRGQRLQAPAKKWTEVS